jgi:hypothetical protein
VRIVFNSSTLFQVKLIRPGSSGCHPSGVTIG